MNNTFSFERFGKVLAMDFRNYIRNYGISLIVLCSMPIAWWLLSLIFGAEFGTTGRGLLMFMIIYIASILAPAKVYGKVNQPREGVAFAILPASALEKFLSMFLYCAILTPAVCFVGGWAIDSLLTLLPFGGFKEFVNMFGINTVFSSLESVEGGVQLMEILTPFKLWFSIIAGLLFWIAIFMLGNMIFKKRKVGKTLACYLGFSYVIGTVFSVIMLNSQGFIKKFENMQDVDELMAVMKPIANWSIVVNFLLLMLVLYFVYRKIKTQKY